MNALNYAEENICIIANTNKKLEELKDLLDKKLGLEANVIDDDFNFETTTGVRLCTMQKCKGLDFPVVLFYLDHRAHFLDVFDEATADKMNRNMIYTAITRSIEMLHIFTLEDSTADPINDLKSILKN